MDVSRWLSVLTDPATLLTGLGSWVVIGLGVVVFIESGVLFPFLPGDSLLVTAAILRSPLGISVWQIVLVAWAAAVLGDQVGFWLGHRFGRRLFKPDARVLRIDRLEAAEAFFARHGRAALVLGRFVPIVRTYVPLAAGAAAMPYSAFIGWNVLGGEHGLRAWSLSECCWEGFRELLTQSRWLCLSWSEYRSYPS